MVSPTDPQGRPPSPEPEPTAPRPASAPPASPPPATPPPAPTPPSPPPAPGTSPSDAPEWPALAADKVVGVVDQVRAKTTGPVLQAARAVVYGLIVAVLAVVVGVLFVIFAVRLLDELLPSGVWLPYLLLGALFSMAGALVFRQRKPRPAAG